jgi:hypothetical protein
MNRDNSLGLLAPQLLIPPPSPLAEKTTASQDQARKASADVSHVFAAVGALSTKAEAQGGKSVTCSAQRNRVAS